jgi:TolB-like protein/tRNA A-37 threonylcarbamoyl transferase component Bud32/Tfp pilus assembly protein PilF
MPLAPGTRLGPYEITAALGAGGMGEVYLATDSRLGRDVAVKVLPQHLSDHPELRARFEREARTVSALNHPHICTVHDVGVHDGQPYLVMERLSGQSLSQVIGRQPMPIARVLELGEQIADALEVAHRAGIVHRDLKPANLFVTDRGDAKVLDFGLAKSNSTAADDSVTGDTPTVAARLLTEVGTTVGTVAYMSPEQARTERVDARSDLFSLGVVLYEMATGRLPFEGKSAAELFAAILKTDPNPPSECNPEVPAGLEAVILKALEKDPALRYQTAAELRADLLRLGHDASARSAANASAPSGGREASPLGRRDPVGPRPGLWVGVAVIAVVVAATLGYFAIRGGGRAGARRDGNAVPEHSIAVLPFTDMSPGKDQEYFSDGISEELLNLLAKIPQLQVTARTSSFSFKGKEVAIPEIARRLHVRHVLEGSVRKSGNKVRITAQLVDAATDAQLWSETYDRTLDDVFAIQDEIAADVVKELKVKILGAAPRARETDPEAYALYLQATQLTRKRSAEAFVQADTLLRRVLAADPRYVPAWSQMAGNAVNEVTIGMLSGDEGFARAREAATKALEIDPEFARAHASLGSIAIFEGDVLAAAQHFERALALDPTDLVVLGNSSAVLKSLGRLDEAVALDEAVVRRDPVNTSWSFNLACAQNWAGRYDQAIGSLRTVLSLSPGFGGSRLVFGEALLGKGDAPGALAEIQQEPNEAFRMIGLPMAYHALRRNADSDTALAALIAKYGKDAPYDVAYVYAFRGEADRAFEWLDRAAAAHDPSLTLVLVENLFASLHSDPRWLRFLRKLGKAPEQLAKIPFNVTLPAATQVP